jgi:protein TonB
MNGLRSLSTLHIALGISVAFHVALLALHFAAPEDFDRAFKDMPLEVVLVNARSDRTPERVQAIAQNNLEGGGEARDNQRVTTPLPPAEATATGDAMQDTERRIENLQEQQEQLLAQIRQQLSEVHEPDPHRDLGTPQARAEEQRRRQMLQLLGEIEKRINEENSRPKKRYLSPSTRQSDEALYYDHYRRIVEREGTRNFPTEHGRKLYGTLIMLVSLNAHGEVIATEVAQSSGIPALDRQAQAIARQAGPFGEVTPQMRRRAAIWVIPSQFRFSREGGLETRTLSSGEGGGMPAAADAAP